MDRRGIGPASSSVIKALCFQHDAKTRCSDITKWVDSLCQTLRIIKFTYKGSQYLLDPVFAEEQPIHPKERATYEVPTELVARLIQDWAQAKARLDLGYSTSTSTSISTSEPETKNQAPGVVESGPHSPGVKAELVDKDLEKLQAIIAAMKAKGEAV